MPEINPSKYWRLEKFNGARYRARTCLINYVRHMSTLRILAVAVSRSVQPDAHSSSDRFVRRAVVATVDGALRRRRLQAGSLAGRESREMWERFKPKRMSTDQCNSAREAFSIISTNSVSTGVEVAIPLVDGRLGIYYIGATVFATRGEV